MYTQDQVQQVEKVTRGQYKNRTFLDYKVGVISASVAHSVHVQCTDSVAAVSTAERICGNGPNIDHLPQIKYGRTHEDSARKDYEKRNQKTHQQLTVRTCGLFKKKEHIYFGASPDGLISCKCCGQGVLEIKCPYSLVQRKNTSAALLRHAATLPYITKSGEEFNLKQSHTYYSQVQWQN